MAIEPKRRNLNPVENNTGRSFEVLPGTTVDLGRVKLPEEISEAMCVAVQVVPPPTLVPVAPPGVGLNKIFRPRVKIEWGVGGSTFAAAVDADASFTLTARAIQLYGQNVIDPQDPRAGKCTMRASIGYATTNRTSPLFLSDILDTLPIPNPAIFKRPSNFANVVTVLRFPSVALLNIVALNVMGQFLYDTPYSAGFSSSISLRSDVAFIEVNIGGGGPVTNLCALWTIGL